MDVNAKYHETQDCGTSSHVARTNVIAWAGLAAQGTSGPLPGDVTLASRTNVMIFDETLLERIRAEGAHDDRDAADASDHEEGCAVPPRAAAMIFAERLSDTARAGRPLHPSDVGNSEARQEEPANAGARRCVNLSDFESNNTSEVQHAHCDTNRPQQRPAAAHPADRRIMPRQVRPSRTAAPPDIKVLSDDCDPAEQDAGTVRVPSHSTSPMVPSRHTSPPVARMLGRDLPLRRAAGHDDAAHQSLQVSPRECF